MRNTTTFLFVLARVVLAICVLLCFGCGPNPAKIYNDQGLTEVNREQYENAIASFDSAIEINRDFAEAYYNRGNTKVKLAEHKIANADYHTLLQLKFTSVILRLYIAAIIDFDTTIRLKPDHVYAYHNRGLSKLELGQTEAAKEDLKTALELAEQAGDTQLKAAIEAIRGSSTLGYTQSLAHRLNSLWIERNLSVLEDIQAVSLDQVLSVGDKLPYFSNSFPDADKIVRKENYITKMDERIFTDSVVSGGTFTFSGVIKLQNGKLYYAPGECTIKYPNGIITKGEIRVYNN